MATRVLAASVNLRAAAIELVRSARRRQIAPSSEARAQHLGELEAKADLLSAIGVTGGLEAADVVAIVMCSMPPGTVPQVGGSGLTGYLNTWAGTVAWMLQWTDRDNTAPADLKPEGTAL